MLIRRFEQVRRSHPLQGGGRLVDGIAAERELLRPLRESADLVVDTSAVSVPQLRATLERAFGGEPARRSHVTVVSFGFKYGLPMDSDLVVDVRFLPNPFWIPELRDLDRPGRGGARLRAQPGGRRGVHRPLPGAAAPGRRRLPAGGQALPDRLDRLHRRQAPQRGDRRGDRAPAERSQTGSERVAVNVTHRDMGRE